MGYDSRKLKLSVLEGPRIKRVLLTSYTAKVAMNFNHKRVLLLSYTPKEAINFNCRLSSSWVMDFSKLSLKLADPLNSNHRSKIHKCQLIALRSLFFIIHLADT